MQIGYVPNSEDLTHPADRRRLAGWATGKKINLNIQEPLMSDVLVLSNAANFGYWLKRAKQPVVLDLVDAYLGEQNRFFKDFSRNIIRTIRGTSNFHWITYTSHLRRACEMSDAVVVASKEQRELILPYNQNVYVISDDHSEVDQALDHSPAPAVLIDNSTAKPHILWEGYGYTLKHFNFMAGDLDQFLHKYGWGMYLVTSEVFPRWGGYIGEIDTKKLIKKMFPLSWRSIQIIPWSLENLVQYSKKSRFAIIPINPDDKFASLKSENKLLSMWHLDLTCFVSDIPSYRRLLTESDQLSYLTLADKWLEQLVKASKNEGTSNSKLVNPNNYLAKNHNLTLLHEQWSVVFDNLLQTASKPK